ncbi:MAG TPA: GlsB/YeaQ/YmgE family stress response membrane protein, partial [Candidatus Binataceae bacterium]|nr:GlsB/YeaQ/YmgE family stress response membrane protein [Candidatus Binataceae bacterium]
MHLIGAMIIGLIAGWIAGKLMSGEGFGIIADIVLGLVGAVLGRWIFLQLGIPVHDGVTLATATVGAIILVAAAHLIRG